MGVLFLAGTESDRRYRPGSHRVVAIGREFPLAYRRLRPEQEPACLGRTHYGRIALIHWYDRLRRTEEVRSTDNKPVRLGDTDYFRLVLNDEDLAYVFTRVALLS